MKTSQSSGPKLGPHRPWLGHLPDVAPCCCLWNLKLCNPGRIYTISLIPAISPFKPSFTLLSHLILLFPWWCGADEQEIDIPCHRKEKRKNNPRLPIPFMWPVGGEEKKEEEDWMFKRRRNQRMTDPERPVRRPSERGEHGSVGHVLREWITTVCYVHDR